MNWDQELRAAAIDHVRRLSKDYSCPIPWALIGEGFTFRGQNILLGSMPKGIFRPRQLSDGALSVKTVVPKPGQERPYDDQIEADAQEIRYFYQGSDPNHHDNRILRDCFIKKLPLIYFFGIERALYLPIICQVTGDDPSSLTFNLVPVSEFGFTAIEAEVNLGILGSDTRKYAVGKVRRRLHQQRFRSEVLQAYQTKCAICRLRHKELLQAAHIIPDSEEHGVDLVQNGLSLCNLHHSAFDANILGIDPDLKVAVREDILVEKDGPMLEAGLRAFHQKSLMVVPRRKDLRPGRDNLAYRWERFLKQ